MNNTTENQITVISEMQIKSFMDNYILYNDLPPRGKFIASMEDGKTACLDTTFILRENQYTTFGLFQI